MGPCFVMVAGDPDYAVLVDDLSLAGGGHRGEAHEVWPWISSPQRPMSRLAHRSGWLVGSTGRILNGVSRTEDWKVVL